MDNALAIAEQLLRRYGHVYEANQVAIVGSLFARDPAAACRALNHADWWDDRRSVASVDLALTGGFTGAARADAQALRAAGVSVRRHDKHFSEDIDAVVATVREAMLGAPGEVHEGQPGLG